MGLFNFFGNYNKPGPGVSKDEPPKAAPIRFFEIYFRKFSKLIQVNLIFFLPVAAAACLMFLVYLFPTHFTMQLPGLSLDVWALYAVPLPLVLVAPFAAGITYITRNFAREEHAFVWSDFWDAVKGNWKYFLYNGLLVYAAYVILSFSMIYYYNMAAENPFLYVPFWLCLVVSVALLFAQYYLPVMFITFDLKFFQCYRNALIFVAAGFGRNLLITLILGGLLILVIGVIPIMPLTVLIFIVLLLFIVFSFVSYLINFTVYPVIDRYMIQPYNNRMEKEGAEEEDSDPLEERFSGIFDTAPPEEDDEDKFVYVNGKLVRQSELNGKKKENSEEEDQ